MDFSVLLQKKQNRPLGPCGPLGLYGPLGPCGPLGLLKTLFFELPVKTTVYSKEYLLYTVFNVQDTKIAKKLQKNHVL